MAANSGSFMETKERKVTPKFIEGGLLYYVENKNFPQSGLIALKLTLGLASINV